MQAVSVFVRLATFAAAGILVCSPANATTSIVGSDGISISVDDSGSYAVSAANGWRFSGAIGQPVSNAATTTGIDSNGHYSQIDFDFQTDVARHAFIRAYWDRSTVLFNSTAYAAAANSFVFPNFVAYPQALNHIAFSGVFAGPTFTALPGESPWVFFDAQDNTFVFSPAANFMVAALSQPTATSIASGIDPGIPSLPAGFTHQTLLVIGKGIGTTFTSWGQTLTNLQGKTRPVNDADLSLAKLGYWTDNGATYYYNTESGLTYTGTLLGVKAAFDSLGIGLGYMQLDSWFYPKGPQYDWTNSSDGFTQYEAASALFPAGLGSFEQNLGVPLVTHARWIDASSPYRQEYAISGNVSTDPAYWDYVSGYLQNAGVATYEQDWLIGPAAADFNLTDPEAFLTNMSTAMAGRGLTMQYCMPTPRHVMQSSKYSNLTTIRGAQDRFTSARWTPFLFASTFIGAVGAYPFSDVFMSGETSNLLLATLSAGPVGVGDPIHGLNPVNLLRAVRGDGVIVKPDAPAVPIDSSFQANAVGADTPLIAEASTSFGGLTARYVFAYPTGQNDAMNVKLTDLGITGDTYVYDYATGTGSLMSASSSIERTITGDSVYVVLAPVGQSGMAVIGDTGQFVTWGKKRIASLTDDGRIHLTVAFAAGETSRTIEGYSSQPVLVTVSDGAVQQVSYRAAEKRFSITLTPGADGAATAVMEPMAPSAVRSTAAR